MSPDCCVALPRGAMGLSTVCDCDHTHLLVYIYFTSLHYDVIFVIKIFLHS